MKNKKLSMTGRRGLFRAVLVTLVVISPMACNKSGSGGTLLLKSGFGEGVSIPEDMKQILGSDVPGYSWEDTTAWIRGGSFVYVLQSDSLINYQESRIETIPGYDGKPTRVLRIINKADCPISPATSRTEYSFFGKPAPNDYKEGYVRYRMKLQDNLAQLIPFSDSNPNPIQISQNNHWYMIMEWKEPKSDNIGSREECAGLGLPPGGTNNYRINIGLFKYRGKDEFNWVIVGQKVQPCRVTEWEYINPDINVPLGEWFLVEAYMKKHASEGRVYFAVNGEVVLDTDVVKPEGFTGRTQHPDNPLRLAFWSPIKNYHDMRWNRMGGVSQWYDDFELWTSFPEGHPALTVKPRKSDAK
jgi:hypothetical protein